MKRLMGVHALSFLFAFLVFAALYPSRLLGQATELGQITGRVTDPSGGVLQGATVKVINNGTSVERDVTTDSDGLFAARSLVPGTYRVEVSAPSFQTQVQDNIKLDVAAAVSLNFNLTVGQVSQRVEVAAQGALLQTEESSVNTVVTNTQVVQLPLNGRNFNQLTRLMPGAVRGTSAGGENLQGETFAVAGDRSDNTYYALDGMYNNGTFFKTAAIHPSVDAIQEFKVQTNTSAQFGAAAGANVDVMIKAGTNEFHGLVYEFLRNDKLDARNYFAPNVPEYRQNQFGFTLQGPVLVPKLFNGRNRTFWFFDYEGNRIRQGGTSFQTIPNATQLGGDLSHDLAGAPAPQIYDPATSRYVNGVLVRDIFPGNIIPTNRIKPYATAYANYWFPTTLLPGASNNFINSRNTVRNDDQVNTRIDQKISDKNNLYGRFSWADLEENSPGNLIKDFVGT
ncbi:MAG: carboxypeptidase regulatory-like domain-containing protein, partial [Acidobacteriaceae bacterium]|nr:carboxypeptidase regulatory-like domain-containing protein [Acidobacteriaceae bacterium]